MERIPELVRDFIAAHLVSAAHLEVLLLLRRRPSRHFDATAVSRELKIDVDQAGHLLARLAGSGLTDRRSGRYRYHPQSRDLLRAVDGLADLYPAYRLAVLSFIFSRPTGDIHDHPLAPGGTQGPTRRGSGYGTSL